MKFDGCATPCRIALLLLIFILATCTVFAEDGILVLVVTDTEQHPFANVQIGTAGEGGSPQFTDQNGKARLKLPPSTKPAGWVNLLLLNAPNGLDVTFISPFDSRVRVPPFDNESENYDPVVLAKRGDKSMLESGSGMLALHATINHSAAVPKKKPSAPQSQNKRENPAILGYAIPRLQLVSFDERTPAYGEAGPATPQSASKPQDATATVADCTNNVSAERRDLEKRILDLVNEQRQKQGIGALNSSDALAAAERQHSCRMMALDFLDHVDPELGDPAQRLRSAGVRVTSASENLAQEKSPSDPASGTIGLWLSDPDHRQNMLDPAFACSGVGVAIKPDGTYFVSEIFSAPSCPSSPALAEAAQKFGLSVEDIAIAIKKWGADDLTWKIMALNTALANGTDPFIAVHASSNDVVFGIGNWSFRDCSLQPLLVKFQARNPTRFAEIMGPDTNWLSRTVRMSCQVSSAEALKRMLDSSGALTGVWRSRFQSLGNEHAFQHVQVEQMALQVEKAQREASILGLESEQAVAFCQDAVMRNGDSMRTKLREDYLRDLAAFTQKTGQRPDEEVKLLVLMNRSINWRSETISGSAEETARFDDQARLLAEGNGVVSGRPYDLHDFGIGLTDFQTGVEVRRHSQPATLRKLAAGWIPSEDGPATSGNTPKP